MLGGHIHGAHKTEYDGFSGFVHVIHGHTLNSLYHIIQNNFHKIQLEFLLSQFKSKNLLRYYAAAEDIVKFYGAISRTTDTGKSETVHLNYNAEYVASDYASDIRWFTENLKPQFCNIQTFKSHGEVDFKFVKK